MDFKKLAIASALLTAGCSHASFPASEQPRALVWGIAQPNCVAACIAHVTVTDAEKGQASTAVTVTDTMSPVIGPLKALKGDR